MPLILALESSSPLSSWAMTDGDSRQTLAQGQSAGRASGSLFESLSLRWPRDLIPNQILVGVGPGSFSGIRVAIAAALGMARVWRCPVTPVRSTHALARRHADVDFLGLFSDAKRGQIFFTAYERGQMSHPSHLIARSALRGQVAQCTRALSLGPLEEVPDSENPTASDLILAWLAIGSEPGLALEPIYLHDSVVPGVGA